MFTRVDPADSTAVLYIRDTGSANITSTTATLIPVPKFDFTKYIILWNKSRLIFMNYPE